jgi:hypothetical protein
MTEYQLQKGDIALWKVPDDVKGDAVKPGVTYAVRIGNVYPDRGNGIGARAHITILQRGIAFSCSRPLAELRKAG